MPLHALAPLAPYALRPMGFPFPALAAMAGRAPLGGARETALACLLVCRLVADALGGATHLSGEQRRARAAGARHWLGAATLPGPVRAALVRLAESSALDQPAETAAALEAVMTVTANRLEAAARLELSKLAQALAG